MCLIAISPQPLVIAANRDEFYARPTLPAQPWEDDERIVGGRDLRSGGSWLAMRRDGRFAAVTNVRGVGREAGGPSVRTGRIPDARQHPTPTISIPTSSTCPRTNKE